MFSDDSDEDENHKKHCTHQSFPKANQEQPPQQQRHQQQEQQQSEHNVGSPNSQAAGKAGAKRSTPPPPPSQPDTNWVFSDMDVEEKELKGEIHTADLDEMIKKLTLPDHHSVDFQYEFLLTYKCFTVSNQLFALLVNRFHIEPDPSWPKQKQQAFIRLKQFPIRLRVYNFLRKWYATCPNDFDDELMKSTIDFIDEVEPGQSPGLTKAIRPLKNSLMSNWLGLVQVSPQPTTMQRHCSRENVVSIMENDASTLSRSITHMEHGLFTSVDMSEWLNKSWIRENRRIAAKGICNLIDHFNRISYWASRSILHRDLTVDKRRNHIVKLILVADQCRVLQNFNAVKEIVSGLMAPAVLRLKHIWSGISNGKRDKLRRLCEIVSEDDNYKTLRTMQDRVAPPCMPYIGLYLQMLTQVEEGNQASVDSKINFSRCRLIAKIIQDIKYFQQCQFDLMDDGDASSSTRQSVIDALHSQPCSVEQDDLFSLSYNVEPRKT